jgi:site-specific recombinase XerD
MPIAQVTDLSLEAIERFQQWLLSNGHPQNTVKAYSTDLRMLLQETQANISLENLEELAMYWLNKTRFKMKPKTTVRRIASVRAYAKWAGLGRVLETYVAPTPGTSIPHPLPERIDGVERMCDCAKRPEHAALVALGGFVGCRVSESLSVRPTDFDISTMLLTIRGKGDKTRTVPVSSRAWEYIAPVYTDRYFYQREPLLPFHDRFARHLITDLGKRASLSRSVSSHDLRATFATVMFDKTNNIRLVQNLLGHASSSTTEIYTLVEMTSMRMAVEL